MGAFEGGIGAGDLVKGAFGDEVVGMGASTAEGDVLVGTGTVDTRTCTGRGDYFTGHCVTGGTELSASKQDSTGVVLVCLPNSLVTLGFVR